MGIQLVAGVRLPWFDGQRGVDSVELQGYQAGINAVRKSGRRQPDWHVPNVFGRSLFKRKSRELRVLYGKSELYGVWLHCLARVVQFFVTQEPTLPGFADKSRRDLCEHIRLYCHTRAVPRSGDSR